MTLRRRHPLLPCLLCKDFLTESNCEGNNEDGQTYCNTTSYQHHLLDGGGETTNKTAKCQIMNQWMWEKMNEKQREKEKGKERNLHSLSELLSSVILDLNQEVAELLHCGPLWTTLFMNCALVVLSSTIFVCCAPSYPFINTTYNVPNIKHYLSFRSVTYCESSQTSSSSTGLRPQWVQVWPHPLTLW